MVTKRDDGDGGLGYRRHSDADTAVMAEAVRAAVAPSAEPYPAPPKRDEDKVSLFWRVFGGTVLSVFALIAVTLYNNLTSGIGELRAEVAKLNEAKGESAKKDDVTALRTQLATVAEYRREIDSLKERAGKVRTELDAAKKEAAAAADPLRADLARLKQDVDKNQSADAERKESRDAQVRQLDASLKELHKNLLEAREKIARLEGQQAPMPTKPTAPARKTDGE